MSQSVILAVVHGHEDKSEFMLCGKAEACGTRFQKNSQCHLQGQRWQLLAVHTKLDRKEDVCL